MITSLRIGNCSRVQWFFLKAMVVMCIVLGFMNSGLYAEDVVDATTLTGKYMCGYQGWFRAKDDGSGEGWVHWFSSQTPSASNLRVDLFPDLTEYEDDELFKTTMTYNDGSTVKLFSSVTEKTVMRHFKWMKDYEIDGVWVQRFKPPFTSLTHPKNKVLLNCKKGAEAYGRVFVVMYDLSGMSESSFIDKIKTDWMYLVDNLKITESPRYLHHHGKPLVSVWGWTSEGRPGTAAQAMELINWFKKDAPAKYQATFMGGVNGSTKDADHWSLLPEPWASAFRSMDIISPWTIGRYRDSASADRWMQKRIVFDMAEVEKAGKEYLPVIFPGFSWHNMKDSAQNQIPRRGGKFYWRQAYNAISSGATMLYGAMYDEVDEGTAVFKACPTRSLAPKEPYWLTLDADGYSLPSDWYLQLAGYANRMLNKTIPLSPDMPIDPSNPIPWEPMPTSVVTPVTNTIDVVDGMLHITLPRHEIAEVSLYKGNGQKCSSFECSGADGMLRIPLSVSGTMAKGVYVLTVKAHDRILVNRVVALSR
jgi:hypothetical protein